MKKTFAAIALVFLALGAGKAALADGEGWTMHGFYVEPNVQAYIPFDDVLDNAVYAGGKVGYQWNEWLALEVESGWTNPDLANGTGDLTVVPLLFNARVNLWPGVYMVDPYVFGGVGLTINSIDDNLGSDIDNAFAGQVGVGAEYHINEWLSAYLDLRFLFSDPDISGPFVLSDSQELHSVLVGGGFVWRF